MLPARSRMRASTEFAMTVRRGRRGTSRALVVHVAPGEDGGPTRVGFVVSRAVGPAVARNRVRRRLRHLVRDRLAVLPDGVSVVVRAQPAAATMTSTELATEIDRAFSKALSARALCTGALG